MQRLRKPWNRPKIAEAMECAGIAEAMEFAGIREAME